MGKIINIKTQAKGGKYCKLDIERGSWGLWGGQQQWTLHLRSWSRDRLVEETPESRFERGTEMGHVGIWGEIAPMRGSSQTKVLHAVQLSPADYDRRTWGYCTIAEQETLLDAGKLWRRGSLTPSRSKVATSCPTLQPRAWDPVRTSAVIVTYIPENLGLFSGPLSVWCIHLGWAPNTPFSFLRDPTTTWTATVDVFFQSTFFNIVRK